MNLKCDDVVALDDKETVYFLEVFSIHDCERKGQGCIWYECDEKYFWSSEGNQYCICEYIRKPDDREMFLYHLGIRKVKK